MSEETAGGTSARGRRLLEVAWGFLPLGWVAFGGPQAHIALLQDRFVFRRQWLDEQRLAELLGMGQGLPGPPPPKWWWPWGRCGLVLWEGCSPSYSSSFRPRRL